MKGAERNEESCRLLLSFYRFLGEFLVDLKPWAVAASYAPKIKFNPFTDRTSCHTKTPTIQEAIAVING
jgi:hypothetical protein